MSWEAVTALCGVVVIMGGLLGLFVRQSIDNAIARLEVHLLEVLDKRYVQRIEWEQWVRRCDERHNVD